MTTDQHVCPAFGELRARPVGTPWASSISLLRALPRASPQVMTQFPGSVPSAIREISAARTSHDDLNCLTHNCYQNTIDVLECDMWTRDLLEQSSISGGEKSGDDRPRWTESARRAGQRFVLHYRHDDSKKVWMEWIVHLHKFIELNGCMMNRLDRVCPHVFRIRESIWDCR
jgi:hypothetical protein